MILDLAHAALRVQGELDDGKLIHLVGTRRDRLASILGSTGKGKGLGATERGRGANLAGDLGSSLEGGLARGLRLSDGV